MTSEGKRLYTFVDVNDDTPIQKLTIIDQLRVLLKHLTYDAANDLKSEDAVTAERLRLKADLIEFLHKATDPIRKGEKHEVIVNISNKFDPVFQEVMDSPEIKNFFETAVVRPKIEYDIPYDFMLRLRVKDY